MDEDQASSLRVPPPALELPTVRRSPQQAHRAETTVH
jgi:hypothetical protein